MIEHRIVEQEIDEFIRENNVSKFTEGDFYNIVLVPVFIIVVFCAIVGGLIVFPIIHYQHDSSNDEITPSEYTYLMHDVAADPSLADKLKQMADKDGKISKRQYEQFNVEAARKHLKELVNPPR